MTRGLQSCGTCCMLFSVLVDGRCQECSARWARLSGKPLPVVQAHTPQPVSPHRRKVKVKTKTCLLCHYTGPYADFPSTGDTSTRMRGWCFPCVQQERQRIAARKAELTMTDAGKTCSVCGIFKKPDNFAWNISKARWVAECRVCTSKRQRERKVKPPKPKALVDDAGRECACCRVYKTWAEFYAATGGIRGKMSSCRACYLERNNAYRRP